MSTKVKWLIGILATTAVVAVAVCIIIKYYQPEPVYTTYSVMSTSERADSKSASYAKFGAGYLRYSKDGIAYYDSNNVPQWNSSYELVKPLLDICEDYCAIAGIGNSRIYVFNTNGLVSSVDTVLPIVTASVSQKGYVSVVLEDGNTQYIDMYDTTGEKVYHIKTSIKGNGLPTDISISNDATKLMVAYSTLEGSTVNTSVAFYNFGEVGKNEAERLVGGFDQYAEMIIPKVEFVDNQTAIAFATEKISIYTISQYPKLICDIVPDARIHGMFYSKDYIGLVFVNSSPDYPYIIKVYDMKGSFVGERPILKDYKAYSFVGTNILMYDDFDVFLSDIHGKTRFEMTLDAAIDSLIPISGDDIYVYVSSRKVQKIKLEE